MQEGGPAAMESSPERGLSCSYLCFVLPPLQALAPPIGHHGQGPVGGPELRAREFKPESSGCSHPEAPLRCAPDWVRVSPALGTPLQISRTSPTTPSLPSCPGLCSWAPVAGQGWQQHPQAPPMPWHAFADILSLDLDPFHLRPCHPQACLPEGYTWSRHPENTGPGTLCPMFLYMAFC